MGSGDYRGSVADRRQTSADGLRDLLIADGTWESWDAVDSGPAIEDPGYADDLRRARERTGTDESVLAGVGHIGEDHGPRVALVISEFGFLGGSIGAVAGARVTGAIRRATAERLPVLACPASGGTRMQEGTAAFLQMLAISGAVLDHRAAGLPYLVYLRHPTTGGVFASWGSLGQITWAEPDALVGFLGPRVHQALVGADMPAGVQTAENLAGIGIIDDVVPAGDLAARAGAALSLLAEPPTPAVPPHGAAAVAGDPLPDTFRPVPGPGDVWESVTATRADARPGLADLLASGPAAPLRGQGAIQLAVSSFGGHTALFIGQDRDTQRAGRRIGPADLRVARRGIRLAGELGLPVITVIDTPGAELSQAAEEAGLAAEIAQCTADLVSLPTPSVSVLLGEGAGGAALALFGTDRRIAATDAWLSPLPPEGASVIVHRDVDHAAEIAGRQGISAPELYGTGMVDALVAPGPVSVRAGIAAALAAGVRPDPADRCRVPDPARRRIPAVGAVVHDGAGRILLVQRGHEPQAGLWTVPGGKVEQGETYRQAVAREMLEETGIEIDVADEAWIVDIPTGSGGVFEVHDFVATPRTTDIAAGDDAADAGWFSRDAMAALPVTPGLVDHLRRAGLL